MTEPNEETRIATIRPFDGTDLLPEPAQLAIRESDERIVGREDVSEEPMIFPMLKVLNGTSEVVGQGLARPGQIWIASEEIAVESPLQVLCIASYRTRWMRATQKAAEPGGERYRGVKDCMSQDARTGSVYGLCAECEYAEWDREGDRPIPPMCSELFNFIVATKYGLCRMILGGKSTKSARDFRSDWVRQVPAKNLWHHPLIVTADSSRGGPQNTLYHYLKVRWDKKAEIPKPWRDAAFATHEAIHRRGIQSEVDDEDEKGYDGTVPF
jgi:hypothetical protein